MVDKAKASAMTEYFLLTSSFNNVQATPNELIEREMCSICSQKYSVGLSDEGSLSVLVHTWDIHWHLKKKIGKKVSETAQGASQFRLMDNQSHIFTQGFLGSFSKAEHNCGLYF